MPWFGAVMAVLKVKELRNARRSEAGAGGGEADLEVCCLGVLEVCCLGDLEVCCLGDLEVCCLGYRASVSPWA